MRKAFTLAIAFAGLIALGGCAVTPSVSVHSLSSATPQIITTDSSARAIIMVRKADGGTGFCAEPSPDTAMSAVAKLIAEVNLQNPNIDAKTQIEFQTAVIELTRRTAATQLLRDSFYRICEAGLNQNLTGEQVMKQQELAIQAALKLAEAELAKNQSELAKSLRDPAVRGLWKQLVAPK
jgi:hypothetical protein